ncbi:hypothetical protein MSG28_007794 [Choristoneura fumiferana]|uniref:Uncharacterized protein n=1 Tax=Choristoneura fumiferana TaxID=7141 RepID=A0ACC0JZB9_CHOFU|nr:hypothetical protein MSG28_007794 [Choristoneura fumiferana]
MTFKFSRKERTPTLKAGNALVTLLVLQVSMGDATLGAPCPMPDPSSYCLNGGTCLFELVQEQACKCPEGFNGQRCENKDISNSSSMYHSFSCKLGLSTSYYC